MYKIVYCGYSEVMLRHLVQSLDFKVVAVLSVRRRVNAAFLELLERYKINSIFIESKKELIAQQQLLIKSDCVLIYKFEFIIPEGIVKKGVFVNFHGGDLRTNRGASPTVWSILKQEKDTCLSLYRLIGGIDEGLLIREYRVTIDNCETSVTLDRKLADGIPALLPSLVQYLQGKIQGQLITNGCYRRRIVESDFTIDLEKDTLADISAKIRSQAAYYGAILYYEGNRYRVHYVCPPSEKDKHSKALHLTIPVGTDTVTFEVTADSEEQ